MGSTVKRREAMFKQQGGLCFYCNNPMWTRSSAIKGSNDRMATIEHIVPPKLGGHKTARENLLCTCHQCNRTRGQIKHEKFIALRKKINWQQLAKEEQWRMLGVYKRKKIETQISVWRKQHPVFNSVMCKILYIKGKYRKFMFCVVKKNKQRYTAKTKSLILNTFKQFETVSFKPLSN